MEWIVKDTGKERAEAIMAFDAELLSQAGGLPGPCLHLYEWERPSITYGYFIHPEQLLDLAAVEELGIDIARRPTGGGVVFHMFDMAFSVVVPAHCSLFSVNTLDNYALINGAVLKTVENYFKKVPPLELTPDDAPVVEKACSQFCMARPTKYDVMLRGKKVAGAAQRKTKEGFLHQGMISLVIPDEQLLKRVLLKGEAIQEAMRTHTAPLAEEGKIPEAKAVLKELLAVQLTSLSV